MFRKTLPVFALAFLVLLGTAFAAINTPVITPSYNDGGTTYVSGTSRIRATNSVLFDSCEYTVDGSNWNSCPDGVLTTTINGVDTSSASSIRVRNSTHSSPAVAVTPDTSRPTASDNVPVPTQYDPFEVVLTCTDTGSGCRRINYTTNGGNPYTSTSYVGPSNNWRFTLSTPNTYDITYAAVDNVSNLQQPPSGATLRIASDSGAPTTTDNIIPGWQMAPVDITFSCLDSGSGCDRVYYTTDNTTPTLASAYVDASDSWTFTISADGAYTIAYFGVDKKGNQEEPNVHPYALRITTDTDAPVTTDNVPAAIMGGTTTVTLTCDDDTGCGCSRVYYTTNGSTPTLESHYVTAVGAWTFYVVQDGYYTIRYFGVDNIGNQESVKTASNLLKIRRIPFSHSAFNAGNLVRSWDLVGTFSEDSSSNQIEDDFFDPLLYVRGIRVRILNGGAVEDDVYSVSINPRYDEWNNDLPLAGDMYVVNSTNIVAVNGSTNYFFMKTDGRDVCGNAVAPDGLVFGTDEQNSAVIAASSNGAELVVNCGGAALDGRIVEIYTLKISEFTDCGVCGCSGLGDENCFNHYIGDTCMDAGYCSVNCDCIGSACGTGFIQAASGELYGSDSPAPSASVVHSQFGTSPMLPTSPTILCSDAYHHLREKECDVGVCVDDPSDMAFCDKLSDCVTRYTCFSDIQGVADAFFGGNQVEAAFSLWWFESAVNVNAGTTREVCSNGEWTDFVGTVTGHVYIAGTAPPVPIEGAKVSVVGAVDGTVYSTTTDVNGYYELIDVPGGRYDLIASKDLFQDDTQIDVDISLNPNNGIDFYLIAGSILCDADCTGRGNDICNADCDGDGGCSFYTDGVIGDEVKTLCDNQRVGFVRQLSDGRTVVCCDGTPYMKEVIPSSFEVDAKHVSRVVRTVLLPDGRLGKMVVYTFK